MDQPTPYGDTSDPVQIGTYAGYRIAFIPRHGTGHTIPPHQVPYKANLYALSTLGISHVLATCIVGSLREEIEPGTFVVPDQFIDRTWGRDDTWSVDQTLVHLPMADPYCSHCAGILVAELAAMDVQHRVGGTVVVIQGPRFSTRAESKMFALWGGDIVNMTQYPEVYFARELGICYASVASVTDYDVGVPSALSMHPDSMGRVLEIFHRNVEITRKLLTRLVARAEDFVTCTCAQKANEPYYEQDGSL